MDSKTGNSETESGRGVRESVLEKRQKYNKGEEKRHQRIIR